VPVLDSGPQKVFETLTLRENYYVWMRDFVVAKSFKSGILAHRMNEDLFVALISPCSLSVPESTEAATDAVQGMKAHYIESFNAALWTAWEQKTRFLELIDEDVDYLFEFQKYLRADYFTTLKTADSH
jgi:hypothetical protein